VLSLCSQRIGNWVGSRLEALGGSGGYWLTVCQTKRVSPVVDIAMHNGKEDRCKRNASNEFL
jgi:hypothetical protein